MTEYFKCEPYSIEKSYIEIYPDDVYFESGNIKRYYEKNLNKKIYSLDDIKYLQLSYDYNAEDLKDILIKVFESKNNTAFELSGPLVFYSSFVELNKITRLFRKDKETLIFLIERHIKRQLELIDILIERKIDFISLADPIAGRSIIGDENMYFLAENYMYKICRLLAEREVKVHICPSFSTFMEERALLRSAKIITSETLGYQKLISMHADKKIFGERCIKSNEPCCDYKIYEINYE